MTAVAPPPPHQYAADVAAMHREQLHQHRLSIHPYFCPLLGYDPSTHTLLMKCYAYGSLTHFLREHRRVCSLQVIVALALDVADGLRCLHAQLKMAHGQVHPDNVLLEYSATLGRFRAVLSDFGRCAAATTNRASSQSQNRRPTTRMISNQMNQCHAVSMTDSNPTAQDDMRGLAVVLHALLGSKP